MQLGDFVFRADRAEYDELQRQLSRRWAPVARHGRPPLLEDLGREAAEVELSGSVAPRARRDLRPLESLIEEAGLAPGTGDAPARPLTLYVGGQPGASGEATGDWAVLAVRTVESEMRFGGVPARIDFRITIREHVG